MSDSRLPEPSNEFLSDSRRAAYPKTLGIHVKNFKERLNHAGTLHALGVVKQDVMRSDVQSNFQAVEELRGVANARAKELGFKGSPEWWS